MKRTSFLLWGVLLTSCGSDDSGVAGKNKSLVQDVRDVAYGLKTASLIVEARNDDGIEVIRKDLTYRKASKDSVRRLIDGPNYVLQVNDVMADVNVSAEGRMQYTRRDSVRDAVCELVRSSRVWGSAIHDRLDLNWEMILEIKGMDCSTRIHDEFVEFHEEELTKLNLESTRDAVGALDQGIKRIRFLKVTAHIKGDTY